MISRSHFDSRLVGFKVWCHYSEGVRKKKQTSSSAGGEVEEEAELRTAQAHLGRAGRRDSKEMMYKAADNRVHVPYSPLQRLSTWSWDIFSVALLGWSWPPCRGVSVR